MRFRRVENVIVVVHTSKAPTNDDWGAYIETVLATGRMFGGDLTRCSQLVFTDGGGPDAGQRAAAARAAEQMNGKAMPVAVLSLAPFVRVIVSALHWFKMNVKAFHPSEVRAAFEFLKIAPAAARSLWIDLNRMEQELGGVDSVRSARDALGRG